MDARDRNLGMHRDISRRDFLNGAAVALTGALVAPPWLGAYGLSTGQNPEQAADYYPSAPTGMRGSHAGSFEVVHQLPRPAIVGAGGGRHRRALRPRRRRRRYQRTVGRAFLSSGGRAPRAGARSSTTTTTSAGTRNATNSSTTGAC